MDLMSKYTEEIHDYHEYKKMCREARAEEKYELAFWLERIAADERSHAKWLHGHLTHEGKMTPAGEELWKSV